jgi:hypothetical protein
MATTKYAVSLEDLKNRGFTKVKVAGEAQNPPGMSCRIYIYPARVGIDGMMLDWISAIWSHPLCQSTVYFAVNTW